MSPNSLTHGVCRHAQQRNPLKVTYQKRIRMQLVRQLENCIASRKSCFAVPPFDPPKSANLKRPSEGDHHFTRRQDGLIPRLIIGWKTGHGPPKEFLYFLQ